MSRRIFFIIDVFTCAIFLVIIVWI